MIKVNLLSPEKKEVTGGKGPDTPSYEEERENKISIPAAIIVAILTLGVIGYMYYEQSKTIDERRKNLLELEATRKEKMIILDKIKELEKKKANLDKKYQLIEDLKARQQDVVRVMDEVLNALPEWVWFTKLTFSNRTLVINGKTSSNEQVSTFMNNMKGTQIFYDVEFPGSNRLKDGTAEIFSFGLKCKYREKEKENENDKNKTKEKDKNKDKTKSTDTNKKVG